MFAHNVNRDISLIIWRFEWQSRISIVNQEYRSKCCYSDDGVDDTALYIRMDHGEGEYDFDWNICNYRYIGEGVIFPRNIEIHNCYGEEVGHLCDNYEYTATVFLRNMKDEFRSASLSLRCLKRRKIKE